MATLLHISASPLCEASFSGRIAEQFVARWQLANPDGVVDTLNVWTEPLPAFDAVAANWKVKTMAGQAHTPEEVAAFNEIKKVTDRFQAADRYLVSCPMWNFHIPYKLKHYIDVLVQPGLTFGFDPARGYFGLVPPERPVQLILSRAGSYQPGQHLAHLDLQQKYLENIFGFIGLTNTQTILMECTAYGPAVSDGLLEQAIGEAQKRAASF